MPIITRGQIRDFLGEQISSEIGPDITIESFSPLGECRVKTIVFIQKIETAQKHAYKKDVLYFLPEAAKNFASDDISAFFVTNPRLSYLRCLAKFFEKPVMTGIHPTAIIASSAKIGNDCYIGPYCIIDDSCVIGNNCIIQSHVHIYERVIIGNNVTIDSGSVIGADGFGYERNEDQALEKFPHLGNVIIEDDVDIGALTCVDRGALGNTLVRRGGKIDNYCQVGHNIDLGEDSVVTAFALIGGSSKVGERCWVGPCASIIDNITVGNDVFIGIASNVIRNVPDNLVVVGNPAKPLNKKT